MPADRTATTIMPYLAPAKPIVPDLVFAWVQMKMMLIMVFKTKIKSISPRHFETSI